MCYYKASCVDEHHNRIHFLVKYSFIHLKKSVCACVCRNRALVQSSNIIFASDCRFDWCGAQFFCCTQLIHLLSHHRHLDSGSCFAPICITKYSLLFQQQLCEACNAYSHSRSHSHTNTHTHKCIDTQALDALSHA